MINIDQQVARAMTRISAAEEWRPVREWLDQCLADADRKLRSAKPEHIGALQGEARCLETLIEKFESAREIDARFESHLNRKVE